MTQQVILTSLTPAEIAAAVVEHLRNAGLLHQAADPLLPRKEAAARLGVSASTFDRLRGSKGFPAAKYPRSSLPRKGLPPGKEPTPGRPLWLASDIDAYKARL